MASKEKKEEKVAGFPKGFGTGFGAPDGDDGPDMGKCSTATWPLNAAEVRMPPGCFADDPDGLRLNSLTLSSLNATSSLESGDADELRNPLGLDFGEADLSSWKTASFGSFRPPGIGPDLPAGGKGDAFPFGGPMGGGPMGMPPFFGGSAAELEAQAAELDFRAAQLKQAALQAEMAAHQARSAGGMSAPPMGLNGFADPMGMMGMMGGYMGNPMMADPAWMGAAGMMDGQQSKGSWGARDKANAKPKKAGESGTAKNAKSASSSTAAPGTQTTVMLRNIPNNYNREMVLELLDTEGFKGRYDFVYLPMDFHRMAGLGYAFVNLVDTEAANAVKEHFEGFKGWKLASQKVCEVSWGEPLQGLEAHIERYRNSPVMHEDVPDKYKPVLYKNGERVLFPAPTKKIRPPRVKKSGGPPGKGGADAGGDGGDIL